MAYISGVEMSRMLMINSSCPARDVSYGTVSLALFGRKRRRKKTHTQKRKEKHDVRTTSIDIQDSVRDVMMAVLHYRI